jgi:cell wall-associated NlpC family hydrolase
LPWHIVSAPNFAWESIEPSGYKAPLVGREWAHGVLDCYAIVRDYYAEKGVELRDYERNDDWWRLGQNLYLDNFGKEGFKEIPFSELAVGDLILMKMRSQVPNHAAVYLGNNIILHHLSNRLSSRDVYGEYFRRQTHSVLRYDPTQNNHTVR